MIRYTLDCACGHQFSEWFANMADYDAQASAGTLTCPQCGGHTVSKAIMAPNVGRSAAPALPAGCANTQCASAGTCPMMMPG